MKTIFITGVSSWIWSHLAKEFLWKNRVYWVSRRTHSLHGIAHFQWDLRDSIFLKKIAWEVDAIDYLIINAGVWYFWTFEDIEEDKNSEILEINLVSPIIFVHKLLGLDKIKKWIIFIGSYAWKKSMKYGSVYMASKFWLRWFAMGLKNETSLWIHIINPKIVATEFHINSNIDTSSLPHTELKEIFDVVEEIIEWKEKRFEIDL